RLTLNSKDLFKSLYDAVDATTLTTVNAAPGTGETAVGASISVRDQQGERRTMQDPLGSAARQHFMQTRVAEAAHHQQVCTKASALGNQHVGRLVFLADRAIFYGIDAVMAEVKHRVIGLQRVRLRGKLANSLSTTRTPTFFASCR